MFQKIATMSDGDINIRVNYDDKSPNQFNVWDDDKSSIMFALSLKEAESLCALLGSAIQDYKISEGK